MFALPALTLIAAIAMRSCACGARAGMQWGWIVAMLLGPLWLVLPLGTLNVDLRTVAGVAGLICLWVFGRRTDHRRWLFADTLFAGLIAIQFASDYWVGQLTPLTAAETARCWLLPYLVGRWFFDSEHEIPDVLPTFARAILVLTLYAVFEAVTHVNPVNALAGKSYGVLEDGPGYRWGLKRAQALFDHPIYFGFVLVLVLPWAVAARRRAIEAGGPGWWKSLPYLVAAALVCTVSRGPIIAGALTACVPALLARPRWWAPVATGLATVVCTSMLFQGEIVEALASVAGENTADPTMLVIAGEEVEYTGTSHRVLMLKVYEAALEELDPLGYGSKLAGVNIDEAPERFRSIDSHYLLFLLQRGPLGLSLFVLFALVTLFNLASLARDPESPAAELAAGLCGGTALVAAMMVSVWFAPDFGGVWLFGAGLAGNWRSLRLGLKQPDEAMEWGGPRPRLVSAHAPVRSPAEPEELTW
jgi:hypothetical protein